MKMTCLCIATLGLAGLLPDAAGAQESYYVIIFGSQRPIINQPAHTHTWATFIRVVGDPAKPQKVEPYNVSWLAATMIVRPLALFPEPGANVELHRSVQWALDDCQRVSMWGPYQIDKCLFDRALDKQASLEAGEVRYKAEDIGHNSARVSNCIHAVADIVQGPRLRIGQPGWGQSASYFVALTYRPFIIDDQTTHDWLLDALALRNYPIVRRDLEDNPTRNILLRGMQNIWQYRLR
jgi:hypothetical protein